jgi:protein-tyrosine phosphatase
VVTIAIDDSGHAAEAFLGAMSRVCDQIDAWIAQGRTVMVHCQHGCRARRRR